MIKTLQKVSIEGTHLNIIKAMYINRILIKKKKRRKRENCWELVVLDLGGQSQAGRPAELRVWGIRVPVLKGNFGGTTEIPHGCFLIILLLRCDVTLTSAPLTNDQQNSNFWILLIGRFCQDIETEKMYSRVSWNFFYPHLALVISGLQKNK